MQTAMICPKPGLNSYPLPQIVDRRRNQCCLDTVIQKKKQRKKL